jgi:hypothetical protein
MIVRGTRTSSGGRDKKHVFIDVECLPEEAPAVQQALSIILQRHGRINASAPSVLGGPAAFPPISYRAGDSSGHFDPQVFLRAPIHLSEAAARRGGRKRALG